MPNDEVLQEYKNCIKKFRIESAKAGISEEEFKQMYFESIKTLTKKDCKSFSNNTIKKKYLFILIGCIASFTFIYNFKTIYSCFICDIQEYIYPGLRLLRKISIPFIQLFPSLTALYQETCLVQNPFFTVVDMDCWPCSTVNNIGEIYDPQPKHQHNAPFIYKTDQINVNLNVLKTLNIEKIQGFPKEDQKVLINNKYYPLENIFNNDRKLAIWKINNINMARALRKLIPRPKVVPKFGQSIERFLIVDSKQATFHIPDTECNYSFLLVTNGQRVIDLKPAEECRHQCKSFKVELKESYLCKKKYFKLYDIVLESSCNKMHGFSFRNASSDTSILMKNLLMKHL